jgi:hypothetical protein
MANKSSEKEIIDPAREERIDNEVVVDAYGEYERATGWHTYLEDRLTFPFKAQVIKKLDRSPLNENEIVTVLKMAEADECESSMYVQINWEDRTFSVPLEQLYPIKVDGDTIEAVEDWH